MYTFVRINNQRQEDLLQEVEFIHIAQESFSSCFKFLKKKLFTIQILYRSGHVADVNHVYFLRLKPNKITIFCKK